nr:hypothetical protein [Tanacetum cinerariifolium]
RGRPRKYPADVSVSPLPPAGSTAAAGDGGYSSPAGMSNSWKKRVKRKRGSPRKYPADVSGSPLMLPPPPGSTAAAGDGGYSSLAGMSNFRKKRGIPSGSINKQHHPAAS